jgi:hypothetical protein
MPIKIPTWVYVLVCTHRKKPVTAGPSSGKFGIGQIYKCLLTCPIFVKNRQNIATFHCCMSDFHWIMFPAKEFLIQAWFFLLLICGVLTDIYTLLLLSLPLIYSCLSVYKMKGDGTFWKIVVLNGGKKLEFMLFQYSYVVCAPTINFEFWK